MKASVQHQPTSNNDQTSSVGRKVEATIRALEQEASNIEEAYYEALRETRDASRKAAELRLQALETRMRICAFAECEPISVSDPNSSAVRYATLRLAHAYFDEPGKYRVVLHTLEGSHDHLSKGACMTSMSIWYSKVVYDSARPETKCSVTISDAVHTAYGAARQQGYTVRWVELPAL